MSHETVNVTFAFPPRVYGVLPAGVAEVVGAALVTSKHVVGVGVWDCMLLVGGVLMAVAGMLMVVRVVVPAAASLVLRVLQGWSTTTNASHTAQTRRGPRWAVVLGGGRRVGRALAAQLCSHRETRHMHILLCDTDPEEVRLAAAELQHATAAPEGSIVACTLDLSSAEMWIELDMVLRRVGAVTGGRVAEKTSHRETHTTDPPEPVVCHVDYVAYAVDRSWGGFLGDTHPEVVSKYLRGSVEGVSQVLRYVTDVWCVCCDGGGAARREVVVLTGSRMAGAVKARPMLACAGAAALFVEQLVASLHAELLPRYPGFRYRVVRSAGAPTHSSVSSSLVGGVDASGPAGAAFDVQVARAMLPAQSPLTLVRTHTPSLFATAVAHCAGQTAALLWASLAMLLSYDYKKMARFRRIANTMDS